MILPFLLASSLLAPGDPQAALHPKDALFYLEVPDLPALLRAYEQAPVARFLGDAEVESFVARIVGQDSETYRLGHDLLERLGAGLERTDPELAELAGLVAEARSFSLSVSRRDSGGEDLDATSGPDASSLSVLGVLTTANAEASRALAAGLARALGASGAELEGEPMTWGLPGLEDAGRLWALESGERLLFGLGPMPAVGAEETSLASDAEFLAGRGRLASGEGTTVYECFWRVDGIVRPTLTVDGAPFDVQALLPRLLPGGLLRSHRLTRLVGGRFVAESFSRDAGDSAGLFQAFGHSKIPAGPSVVPPDAVAAWVTSLDPARLEREIAGLLETATGASREETSTRLRERYGSDPLADLVGALGDRSTFYCQRITGLTLPKVHLVLELRDPEAFERGLKGLGRYLEELSGGEIELGSRPYRNLPFYWLGARRDIGELAGSYGAPERFVTLVPAILEPELAVTVIGDRAILGIGKMGVKREVKRLLLEPTPEQHPLFEQEGAFPADAVSISFVDWGSILKGLYDTARAFAPVIAQTVEDLPFDPANLPDSDLFPRHFRPTIAWTRAEEGGLRSRSDSAFGPEVPLALALAGGGAAFLAPSFGPTADVEPLVVEVRPVETPVPPPAEPVPAEEMDPVQTTRERLRDVRLALVVYKTDQGRFPDELDALFEPTERFPQGFLEGSAPILDAWGRALGYEAVEEGAAFRAWSSGPDGNDDGGAGDDLVVR